MKRISPDFYDKFRCIAGDCTDTCCAGWEIDVDSDSMLRYDALSSPLGDYIRGHIDRTEDCPSFRLKEHDRCPFLNDQNLCEMIIRGGEELLCEICAEHPRFYEWYGNYEERGIGLCCEVGCQLLLACNTPLKFIIEDDEPTEDDISDSFYSLREAMFRIIQNTDMSPRQCIPHLLHFANQMQTTLYGTTDTLSAPEENERSAYYRWLLAGMERLEPLNDVWTETLAYLNNYLPILLTQPQRDIKNPSLSDIQWRNVLCYLLYRHLPKAQWDGLILARTAFAVHSMIFIDLLNHAHHQKFNSTCEIDRINNLKLWSKQVEYCCENTDNFIRYMIL